MLDCGLLILYPNRGVPAQDFGFVSSASREIRSAAGILVRQIVAGIRRRVPAYSEERTVRTHSKTKMCCCLGVLRGEVATQDRQRESTRFEEV